MGEAEAETDQEEDWEQALGYLNFTRGPLNFIDQRFDDCAALFPEEFSTLKPTCVRNLLLVLIIYVLLLSVRFVCYCGSRGWVKVGKRDCQPKTRMHPNYVACFVFVAHPWECFRNGRSAGHWVSSWCNQCRKGQDTQRNAGPVVHGPVVYVGQPVPHGQQQAAPPLGTVVQVNTDSMGGAGSGAPVTGLGSEQEKGLVPTPLLKKNDDDIEPEGKEVPLKLPLDAGGNPLAPGASGGGLGGQDVLNAGGGSGAQAGAGTKKTNETNITKLNDLNPGKKLGEEGVSGGDSDGVSGGDGVSGLPAEAVPAGAGKGKNSNGKPKKDGEGGPGASEQSQGQGQSGKDSKFGKLKGSNSTSTTVLTPSSSGPSSSGAGSTLTTGNGTDGSSSAGESPPPPPPPNDKPASDDSAKPTDKKTICGMDPDSNVFRLGAAFLCGLICVGCAVGAKLCCFNKKNSDSKKGESEEGDEDSEASSLIKVDLGDLDTNGKKGANSKKESVLSSTSGVPESDTTRWSGMTGITKGSEMTKGSATDDMPLSGKSKEKGGNPMGKNLLSGQKDGKKGSKFNGPQTGLGGKGLKTGGSPGNVQSGKGMNTKAGFSKGPGQTAFKGKGMESKGKVNSTNLKGSPYSGKGGATAVTSGLGGKANSKGPGQTASGFKGKGNMESKGKPGQQSAFGKSKHNPEGNDNLSGKGNNNMQSLTVSGFKGKGMESKGMESKGKLNSLNSNVKGPPGQQSAFGKNMESLNTGKGAGPLSGKGEKGGKGVSSVQSKGMSGDGKASVQSKGMNGDGKA